ncbi:hypothetical protein DRN69_01900 [Candidatus Pacearchaeota archaeon]|nr:MAG: hypothetical protein DRN69_01900 [Candidatus Pacearchaeota archaeon]
MEKNRIAELKEKVVEVLEDVKEKTKKNSESKVEFTHINELRERRLPDYIHCRECGKIYLSNKPLKGMEFVAMDGDRIIGGFCSAECLGKGLKKLGKATVYTERKFIEYFINYVKNNEKEV